MMHSKRKKLKFRRLKGKYEGWREESKMPGWLIVYIVINLIIAIFCTIVTWKDGWFDKEVDWPFEYGYETNWIMVILVFVGLLLFGLPVVIVGGIILLFEG